MSEENHYYTVSVTSVVNGKESTNGMRFHARDVDTADKIESVVNSVRSTLHHLFFVEQNLHRG